jgi:HPt (histidine-containing phosphotransfer) domain-containing protein
MTRPQGPVLAALRHPPEAGLVKATPRPSLTRSHRVRKARRVYEARRGNVNALRHGAFARVAALPDIETETALIMATHPNLDQLADHRLAEQAASASVQAQRVLLAMQEEGMIPALTTYHARLSGLVERLERAIFERDRARASEQRAKQIIDLSAYREPEE